jgi:hypothetical protein
MMTIPLGTCSAEGKICAIPTAGVGDATGDGVLSDDL